MIAIEWKRRPPGLWQIDAFACLGFLAMAGAFAYRRIGWFRQVFPSCHFLAFTSYPCGTCGFTRAFVRAAHLDPTGAFSVSPLGTLVFYFWVVGALWVAVGWIHPGVRFPRIDWRRTPRLARWGLLTVFLGNWAYLLLYRWASGAPPA